MVNLKIRFILPSMCTEESTNLEKSFLLGLLLTEKSCDFTDTSKKECKKDVRKNIVFAGMELKREMSSDDWKRANDIFPFSFHLHLVSMSTFT